MADISKIKIPAGTTYNIKDSTARSQLAKKISGYALTGGTTSAYTASISGITLTKGTIILLRFNAANAANATLNVNNLGAKPIYYKGKAITANIAPADAIIALIYDDTLPTDGAWHCVYSYNSNTTYTNASLGQGYGTCSTEAATAAKVVTLSSYSLTTGGIVSISFTNAVPANATLNINSKGAKSIYYKGKAITANIIKAGDIATFIYDGSHYNLISFDRDTTYTLPTASNTAIGGIELGYNTSTTEKKYAVNLDSNAKAYVNVPWTDTKYSDMEGATSSADGTAGLVPKPTMSDKSKYLKGDGTWGTPINTTYSTMTGASSTKEGASGLVPKPAAGAESKFLKGDGTWAVPTDTKYTTMKGASSTESGAAGLVPKPNAGDQSKFLKADGTWVVPTNTTYSNATTSKAGLMSDTDKAKLDNSNIAYGTCSTAAATAEKAVTLTGNSNWKLTTGAIICVKYTNTNTAESPTLNINNTGAKPIYYNTSVVTESGLTYAGYANRVIIYVYNGSQFVFLGWSTDSNTWTAFKGATSTSAGTAGYVPAPKSGETGLYFKSDGTWATPTDTKYTLPHATSSALGGVKVGYVNTGKTYKVQLDSNNNAYVNIPWTDTTYTAGDGISISSNKITNSGVRSISSGETNGTISVNKNGTSSEIKVKGLDTAAYTKSTDYAKAIHDHDDSYLSLKNGGTVDEHCFFKKGCSIANCTGVAGESGFINVATITVVAAYCNSPIKIEFARRSDINTTCLYIEFNSVGPEKLTSTEVINFTYIGCCGECYLYKKDTLVYELYIKKSESHDCIDIVDYNMPYYDNGKVTIEWKKGTQVATMYEDAIKATIGGMINKAYVDDKGQNISQSYIKSLSVSGKTITITKGDGKTSTITTQDTTYTLPIASSSTLGGIKLGFTQADKNYPVKLDSSNKAYVTVPWTDNDTKYSDATTSTHGLMSTADKSKLDNSNIAYGTCSTEATTAAKVVTISGNTNWTLKTGSMISVKFSSTNTASSPTLNVNSTGAKNIMYNGSNITTSGLSYAGYANRIINYIYNGSQFVFLGWSYDSNTTYSDMKAASAEADGSSGLVPKPTAGNQSKFLRGDGKWATPTNTTYTTMKGASSTADGAAGLVPAPVTGDQSKFLRGDGKWIVPTNTTYSTMTGATSSTDGTSGLVPKPTSGNQSKFLRADGKWETPTNTTYNDATTSTHGLMTATDKSKLDNSNIAYGTCSTAADTAAKVVTISGNTNWVLKTGSIISVKFSYTNTAQNPTLNVNSTGAKSIIYNSSIITTSSLSYAGYINRVINYIYNGAQFIFLGWSYDSNTTYSAMKGASSTADGTSGLVTKPVTGDQSKFLRGDGKWAVPTNTTYSNATTDKAGLMSNTDKAKLDGIASGAKTGTVTSITAGVGLSGSITTSGTIKAKLKSETLLTSDAATSGNTANRTYAIAADKSGYLAVNVPWTNTTYSDATTSTHGLMSIADKSKLDKITIENGSFTPKASNTSWTVSGECSGVYTRINNIVFFSCYINFSTGSNKQVKSTDYITGLPIASTNNKYSIINMNITCSSTSASPATFDKVFHNKITNNKFSIGSYEATINIVASINGWYYC